MSLRDTLRRFADSDVEALEWVDPHGWRLRFRSEDAAVTFRADSGCGGWVVGPYLFVGSRWTASRVMRHSPGVEGDVH